MGLITKRHVQRTLLWLSAILVVIGGVIYFVGEVVDRIAGN